MTDATVAVPRQRRTDYLHGCLALHARVTEIRYGKTQRLDLVERDVGKVLGRGGDLWEVIGVIYNHDEFAADMFGSLASEAIETSLKKQEWYGRWQSLKSHEVVESLFAVFRQIEPVSMVLRFVRPEQFGIYSSPVATLLGIRPRRKPTAAYDAYLESLGKLRAQRGFERIADVEMALWALQVGVLEQPLQSGEQQHLQDEYARDEEIRQMHARNLTVQLLSETPKLDLAEALLTTDVPLAGQIAGVEFEQLVGKWLGVRLGETLKQMIERSGCKGEEQANLHDARDVRNDAIHHPQSVTKPRVRILIATARKVGDWLARGIRR